jgi:hypothetical protein
MAPRRRRAARAGFRLAPRACRRPGNPDGRRSLPGRHGQRSPGRTDAAPPTVPTLAAPPVLRRDPICRSHRSSRHSASSPRTPKCRRDITSTPKSHSSLRLSFCGSGWAAESGTRARICHIGNSIMCALCDLRSRRMGGQPRSAAPPGVLLRKPALPAPCDMRCGDTTAVSGIRDRGCLDRDSGPVRRRALAPCCR